MHNYCICHESRCRPFDYCTIDPDPGIVAPMWSWLEHSYYREGVFEYKGKLVGVWTYEVCSPYSIQRLGIEPGNKTYKN